jgi:hypothetical protein
VTIERHAPGVDAPGTMAAVASIAAFALASLVVGACLLVAFRRSAPRAVPA